VTRNIDDQYEVSIVCNIGQSRLVISRYN